MFRELGTPPVVEDVQIDQPAAHEVLIRTSAAGVCHSDLSLVNGDAPWPFLPCIAGHESAGVVEAVGSEVTYVEPGDHVITSCVVFCGECEFCLSGRPALSAQDAFLRDSSHSPRFTQSGGEVHQFAGIGSFSEQLLIHEHAMVKIDKSVPLDIAALIGCGVTTGLGAVFNTAKVAPGTTVVVIGCGGVGLSAIQGARIAGALRIIAVDMVASRRERALQLGATDVVDPAAGDPVAQVHELTRGGADYAFEVVGKQATVAQAFEMLRLGGTLTIVGVVMGTTVQLAGLGFIYEKIVKGCMYGSSRIRIDMPRYVEMYERGMLKLDEMITARISLDEVGNALGALERVEGARSVIVFN